MGTESLELLGLVGSGGLTVGGGVALRVSVLASAERVGNADDTVVNVSEVSREVITGGVLDWGLFSRFDRFVNGSWDNFWDFLFEGNLFVEQLGFFVVFWQNLFNNVGNICE
jgi:hypothetical protein